ncbi:MAG TPA: MFS transporter [Caulobacteraceae bacterium]|jgi:EmrB/QacA subfamily drug resistance transporter|nr:MFS transporter [Caulobacteraceae bacterium]
MSATFHAPCDAASAHLAVVRPKCVRPRLVLAACILASGLAFVDGSVVNVGLPAIGRSLAANSEGLQWIVNAYLLPLSALLLLGGAAGDRYGRRRLLIVGTGVFALSSVGCAMAPSLEFLLAGRLLQGVGAAILLPNSLAILGSTFEGEAKGRAIGVWAASGAALGAIGPVLGGWLVDLGSWRAIFLINLPIAAGAIVLAWRHVPQDPDESGQSLDAGGGALATLGLGALTWALTTGSGRGGWTTAAIAGVIASAGLLGAFLLAEHRRGDRAMMPLAMFGSTTFVGLTLLTLLLYGALGGLFILVPYVLIKGAGYSAVAAGAALLPLPIVLGVTSPFLGALAGRVGSRLPLVIGPLIVAVGFLLALRIRAPAHFVTQVLPAILVIAIGMSGAVAPLTTAVLTSVDERHTGSASGLNSAVARSGGLIATAVLGSVLAAAGAPLLAAFHAAMLVAAAACVAASLSAFALIRR